MNARNGKNEPRASSAGKLMTKSIPHVHSGATIAEVESLLEKSTREFETIQYIYITDSSNTLVGAISIKELFRSHKSTPVKSVMTTNLVTVRMHTSEERSALLALKHNLKAIPVVDTDNHLLGVIPSDLIINVLHKENVEDLLQFAGVHRFKDPAKDLIVANAGTIIKKRFPWLVVGLLGGLTAAAIVGFFEETIKTEIALVAFIPAIAYLADAVGTQSQTIFIRSLSIDHALKLGPYIWREVKVALGLAITLGIIMGGIGMVVGSSPLALVLGLAFFAAINMSVITALFFPWMFTKMKMDPAIASGPFATTIRDITSLLIYFAIATAII
jgi:magnesium transporter